MTRIDLPLRLPLLALPFVLSACGDEEHSRVAYEACTTQVICDGLSRDDFDECFRDLDEHFQGERDILEPLCLEAHWDWLSCLSRARRRSCDRAESEAACVELGNLAHKVCDPSGEE